MTAASTAHVAPAAQRSPGLAQILVLLLTGTLVVMVTAIIGPNLPAMQAHFSDHANADVLVPLTMSVPSLTLAICAIFFGELSDRWGRKRMLVAAALMYAVIGTMPLYLQSLEAIIASRVALGIFEAVLITVSTVLIGDYFVGAKRDRLMTLQTTVAAVSSVALSIVGAALGSYGWRTPYLLYGVGIVFALAMIITLWEPVTRATMSSAQYLAEKLSFDVRGLVIRCLIAVGLGTAFLAVATHLGYLLAPIGVSSPTQIGLAFALHSTGTLVGSGIFGALLTSRVPVTYTLGIASLLGGCVLVALPFADTFGTLTALAFAYGAAMGVMLPAVVTWNMRELPLSKRGLGTGALNSSLFLGMFIGPVLPALIDRVVAGERAHALATEGYVLAALGVFAVLVGLRNALRR